MNVDYDMFDLSSSDEILIAGAIDVDCRPLVVHSLGPSDCAFDIGLVDDAVDEDRVGVQDGDDDDAPYDPVCQTLRLQMRVYEIAPVKKQLFVKIIIKSRNFAKKINVMLVIIIQAITATAENRHLI